MKKCQSFMLLVFQTGKNQSSMSNGMIQFQMKHSKNGITKHQKNIEHVKVILNNISFFCISLLDHLIFILFILDIVNVQLDVQC